MKNSTEMFMSRPDQVEEKNQTRQWKSSNQKSEKKEWKKTKITQGSPISEPIQVFQVFKKEKERKGRKHIQRNVPENLLNMEKERDIQVKEVQKTSNKINSKRSTQRYTIMKLSKVKDGENLKSNKRKVTIQGNPH